jgi:DNA polymerase-3 subunit alpha
LTKFIHLHLHDQYSVLDGLGKAEDYCKRAKELGMDSLALTNHGNVDGCIQFQKACNKEGIKPIFGCEAYIVTDLSKKEKGEKRWHITLLAMNKTGWNNILRMLTVANVQGFYYKPRIDPDLLLQFHDGVAIGSACTSTYLGMECGVELLRRLKRKGSFVYLELMPINMDQQRLRNVENCKLAMQYEIPLVATNDCHYVESQDNFAHEVLLAMQAKKKWNDPKRWKFDVDTLYLQSMNEMEMNFRRYGGIDEAYWSQALANSGIIADACNVSLDPIEVVLPEVDIPEYSGMPDDEQLLNLVMDGFDKRKKMHPWITPEKYGVYEDRIFEELTIIVGLGFASYFLIVFELINWCKKENIMTGPGRGSVGGCLVAFCLGITQVDPLKYDLVFSRFISEARIDLPDIDMDFEKRYRGRIIEHLKELYGEYNVIGISNFLRMKGKSAVRNVSRVFDLPQSDVSKACNAIITRSGGDMRSDFSIEDAFETFEDGINFKKKYPKQAELAMKMEGLIMGHGRHAAGICVARNDLRDGTMMNYANRAGTLVSNWDKKDGEHNGLMKLDILGLQSLDVLHHSQDLIKERHGVEVNYDLIELDDPKVIGEFNSGNCVGVFQFNGNSIMRFCRDIGIEDFEGLVAINALHRPGTLKSGTIHDYKDRKHKAVSFTYPHPMVEEITKNTYGIIVYQEQVMRLMYECGGLPWQTTDTIRKAVSKSQGEKQIMKFKDEFVNGCIKKGTLSQKEAEDIFQTIKTFGAYGFNKAHAVEYSMIAYWQMWLKVYYPTEYMCAILSAGNENKKADHIQEARRLGLSIHLPDINKSHGTEWVADKDGNLLIPLIEIKGIGPKAIEEILNKREETGIFENLKDLENKVNKRIVNIKVRKLLDECLCFSKDDTCDLGEEQLENLSKYFNFSLSNDPMYKYRKILKLLRRHIPIMNIRKCKGSGDLIWGFADKITYQIKTDGEKGVAYSGCYGQLKDEENNYIMMNFDRELYKFRKEEIEHAEGRWMIVRVSSKRHDSLTVTEIWFAEDLLSGNFSSLVVRENSKTHIIKLIEPRAITNSILDEPIDGADSLSACTLCELRQQAHAPVYPDHGRYNAMMIGEAPGWEEDQAGLGFVGASGGIIWNGDRARGCLGFAEYGLSREHFWVTNFSKCYPGKTIKTPKLKHLKVCERWWKKEVAMVKPFVILAFGNTGLGCLTGEAKGIMSKSGVVEWNDDLECFVVYCLHPAAVLYHADNAEIYNKGILSFLDIFLNVGFGAS